MEDVAEKSHSKFETVLYLFVIPILFTLLLTGILMNFLGYPVIKTMESWGSKIPVVKNWVSDTNGSKQPTGTVSPSTKPTSVKQSDVNAPAAAAQAQTQSNANQQEIEDLKKQNEELQKQLDQKQEQQNQDQLQQAASLYANMTGSKAAKIMEALPLDEAAYTLSALDQDQQSSILGSFSDPQKAAHISMLLNEIALGKDQKTVHDMAQQLESPTSTLTETLDAMPPSQSAVIIQNMMTINSKEAMDVMKNMNTATRSQVLSEITKLDPKVATAISTNLSK